MTAPLPRFGTSVAPHRLGDRTDELVGEVIQQFNARMAKAGVAL